MPEYLAPGVFIEEIPASARGSRPEDAYFVRCDASTMTQQDIDQGVLVAPVGFARIRPAEFVVITIRQILGGASSHGG